MGGATDAFLSRKGAVATNTKRQGKRGNDGAMKRGETTTMRPDKNKDATSKSDPNAAGRGNKTAAARNQNKPSKAAAVVETARIAKQFRALRAFVLSRPAEGEAPYLLVGVRYLIVALFFCLAGVAIIDSFSQVPSLFGEATIVVSRPR